MDTAPVTVSLGDMDERAHAMLDTGEYESLDEVVQDGLRALERERAAWTAKVKTLVQEALDDPRPALPLDEAFAEIRARVAAKRR